MSRLRRASPWLLVALLAGGGTLHFLRPEPYDALIPPFLPEPRLWTWGSGVAELVCAAAVAHPRTRRAGALATALLFVAVFPGNVQMALDAASPSGRLVAYARLPLQVPLVLWALQVRRDAGWRRPGGRSGGRPVTGAG